MSYRTHLTVNSALRAILKRSTQIGLSVSAFAPMLALANPTGGQVVAGGATIKNPNANTTVVKQSSSSAIIDWQQFNIGKGQYVQFLQPSSSSVILNRVIGGGGSSIFGSLTGNGQVFLVNTNGVFFGKGASIDAQGFLASTLDISDSNFLSGHYLFDKGSNADAQVINQGNITAHKGGYVVLAGDYAENDGLISAQSGHIVLASGSKSTLTLNGNSLVSYAVNQATLANLAGANNAGKLNADGGTVIMTADVANLLKATVVNNTGLIEAHAISKTGGSIQLLATGGNIVNAGTIDASATHAGQQGGSITLKGDERTTLTSASKIFATGDGANGGNVEVSGNTLSMRGAMNLGKGGNLLLDPGELKIVATSAASSVNNQGSAGNTTSVGSVGVNFIEAQLNNGTGITLEATHTIDASANVHTIKATGVGNFTLHTGSTEAGGINLKGVDVTIGGAFNASMGYGSFGHITAKSIDIEAHDSNAVFLAQDVVNSKGVITTYSVKATGGGLTIDAAHISNESATQALALKAAGVMELQGALSIGGKLTLAANSIGVDGNIHAAGVTAIASGGYARFSNIDGSHGGVDIETGGTFITAGSIHAYGGNIVIKDASTLGITVGNVSITNTNSAGDVDIQAHGVIKAGTVRANDGAVTVDAGSHDISFAGSQVVGAHGVNLSARDIAYTGSAGSFQVNGGTGALAVKGRFSPPGSTEGAFSHDLQLIAAKGIKLDNNLEVGGKLNISGASLAYSGANSDFDIQAKGSLTLAAPIGSAKAPVKYGVGVFLASGAARIERSIYTKSHITVQEAGRAGSGTSATTGAGIYVGDQDGVPITLSAKSTITFSGARVAVDYVSHSAGGLHPGAGPIVISADDGNAKTSTDNILIHAGSVASSFGVFVGAGQGSISYGGGGKLSANRSVTLHAGSDIAMSGRVVFLSGGSFHAFMESAGGSLSVNDKLTLSAGHDVKLTADRGIVIANGTDRASASAESGTKENVSITGGVGITAGHDVIMTASSIGIHGGHIYGFASVGTGVAKVNKATIAVTSGVAIKAGHDLNLTATGHDLTVTGGTSVGTGSGAFAEAAGAVVNVSLHADVSLTAGSAANLKANGNIILHGGSHVGAGAESHFSVGTGASNTGTKLFQERVFADGKGATATVTDTANLTISTGKGGFSASAQTGAVTIRGGSDAGAGAIISATATGAKAGLTAQATISIADKGGFTLKGTNVTVKGGDHAAGLQFSSQAGTVSSGFTHIKPARLTGHGDANMAYNVASGVTITAAGAVSVTTPGLVEVAAGDQGHQSLQVHVDSTGTKGATQVNIASGVSLTGASTVTLKGNAMELGVAGPALQHASFTAAAGTLTVTDDNALHLTAGKGLLASAVNTLFLSASSVAALTLLEGRDGAKVKASVDAGVALSDTKGDMTLKGGVGLFVHGGAAGHGAHVISEQGGSAALVTDTGITLKTAGHLDIDGGLGTLGVQAGRAAGPTSSSSAQVTAQHGKAKSAFTADTSINVSAGSISLEGHQIHIFGGSSLGRGAGVHASSAATVNLQVDAGIVFKTAGVFSASANTSVNILGGPGLMGGSERVTATGGGVATVGLDGSVSIAAGSMSLHGGHNVLVRGGSTVGRSDSVTGLAHGNVTDVMKDGVSLVAAKDLTLTAVAGAVHVLGGAEAGIEAGVTAKAGATASYTADASVLVKGASITVHGGASGGALIGDQNGAGKNLSVLGSAGGKAVFTVDAGVALMAVSGISIDHPASTGNGKVGIGNFSSSSGGVAHDGTVRSHGGSAKATVDASTLLQVTGATGTITLQDAPADVSLVTNAGVALDAGASADFGGAASLGVKAGLTLSAKGAVSITGHDVIVGTGVFTGHDQHEAGNGTGAKVTVNTDASLKINAGKLDIHTSQNTTGVAEFQVDGGAGSGGSDRASNGAVVTSNTDADIDLTVAGKLSISAPGGITLHGGNSAGASVTVGAFFGGKLSRLVTAGVNVAAASASFSEGGGALFLSAGGFIAGHQNVDVTAGASAKLTTQASVLIHTTHAFTDQGAGLQFFSQRAGSADRFGASGAKSLVTAVEQSMVTVTAGGAVTFAVSGAATIDAPAGDVEDVQSTPGAGGAVSLSADTHAGISAGGALSITAGTLSVEAGGHVGFGSEVIAEGGKFTASMLDDASLTAKGNLTLDVTGTGRMAIAAVGADANSASYNAFQGGGIKITQDDGVHIKAGGTVAITLGGGSLLASTAFYGSNPPIVGISGNAIFALDVDAGITILGKSVQTTGENSTSMITVEPDYINGGVIYKAGITVAGGLSKLSVPAPMSLGTLQQGALLMSLETVLGGQGQPTAYEPHSSVIGGARCEVSLLADAGHCIVKR